MVTRRSLLTLSAAIVAGSVNHSFAAQRRFRTNPEIGLNLISWDQSANEDPTVWSAAVAHISAQGFRSVTLVPYWFINPLNGEVSEQSRNGHDPGASFAALAAAATKARELDMKVAVKPIVEVDHHGDVGDMWRGDVYLRDKALRRFFETYSPLLLKLAALARAQGSARVYVGSELAGLTRAPESLPQWSELIARAREAFPADVGQLSYAANYDEYETVRFWDQLDEIGVDAYFPLATPQEAAGVGRPSKAVMIRHWRAHLARLKRFSTHLGKPVRFAEFGIVPRDLSSLSPWEWRDGARSNSGVEDPEEQYNAVAALLEATDAHSRWLLGIDFWHWEMPGSEDSLYNIREGSATARLLAEFVRGN